MHTLWYATLYDLITKLEIFFDDVHSTIVKLNKTQFKPIIVIEFRNSPLPWWITCGDRKACNHIILALLLGIGACSMNYYNKCEGLYRYMETTFGTPNLSHQKNMATIHNWSTHRGISVSGWQTTLATPFSCDLPLHLRLQAQREDSAVLERQSTSLEKCQGI